MTHKYEMDPTPSQRVVGDLLVEGFRDVLARREGVVRHLERVIDYPLRPFVLPML